MSLVQIDVLDGNTVGVDRDIEILRRHADRGHPDLVLTRREVDLERAVPVGLDLLVTRLDRDRRTDDGLATALQAADDAAQLTRRQLGLELDRRGRVRA